VIEIRPCTPEDAPAVSALLGELGYDVSSEAAAERMRRLSRTGLDPTFIAGEDGRPLGLIALHHCHMIQYPEPVARITALVVYQQARRRGIGRLLIDHALRWAEQRGCELVELTSALNREAAHAFYRDLGFEANSLRFRKSLVVDIGAR
jgi:GNAT superfamily N-acetyltransferase